jgi:hypothetical protein
MDTRTLIETVVHTCVLIVFLQIAQGMGWCTNFLQACIIIGVYIGTVHLMKSA